MATLPEFGMFRSQFTNPEEKRDFLARLGIDPALQGINLRKIAPQAFGAGNQQFFSPQSFLEFAAGRGATTLQDILSLLRGQ